MPKGKYITTWRVLQSIGTLLKSRKLVEYLENRGDLEVLFKSQLYTKFEIYYFSGKGAWKGETLERSLNPEIGKSRNLISSL